MNAAVVIVITPPANMTRMGHVGVVFESTIQPIINAKMAITRSVEDRKAKCFYVPFDEIKANGYDLSISKYKEIVHEEVNYEKPHVIKKKILELEEKIIDTLREIEV